MSFFEAALRKGGKELAFFMNPLLRGITAFAFLSVAAMLALNFSGNDFLEAPLLGKVNVILLPFLLLLGSVYRYTIRFDAEKATIRVERGLVVLFSVRTYRFDELAGLEVKGYATRKIDVFSEKRYSFGFRLAEKVILLDKALPEGKAKRFVALFRCFFPGAGKILTDVEL